MVRFLQNCSSKESVKTIVTIWLVPLFLESSFVQLLETETANKVFWMKLAKHGSDTATRYCLVTASTEGTPQGMVVSLTVGETFMLEKGPVVERTSTLFAHKTVWMPLLVET